MGEECQNQPPQWPKQSAPPHIGGRHRMLYFNIQRTEKYSIAMCYMHSHFKEGIPEKNTISFGHCLNYPPPASPARNMGHYFHLFATRKCRYFALFITE